MDGCFERMGWIRARHFAKRNPREGDAATLAPDADPDLTCFPKEAAGPDNPNPGDTTAGQDPRAPENGGASCSDSG
jgi:hypothetical protein